MQRLRAAGLGFCGGWPDQTVHNSPAFRAYLTRPGRTADICKLSSHLQIFGDICRHLKISATISKIFTNLMAYSESLAYKSQVRTACERFIYTKRHGHSLRNLSQRR